MDRTNLTILITGLAFSALFYDQLPGLNFTLFALLLTAALLLINPQKCKESSWWFYALLANVCGICVFFVTSGISVVATLVSVVLLAGKTCAPQGSVPVAGFYGGLSVLLSPYSTLREGTSYLGTTNGKKNNRKTTIAVIVAFFSAIPFLVLYQASNPLFARFLNQINFSWPDGGWCLFTVFSILFIYGLLKARSYNWLEALETKLIGDIAKDDKEERGADNVATVGVVLFTLLNIMLLLLNALDINQLYITKTLPRHISLSSFVHEAVTATIVSIVFAVSFIMFFFRGELNFHARGRVLRYLVYAWILQTGLVVVNTMIRNSWYIGEYQLTGLRIGVFVFLTLSLIGLTLTWYKISARKSAWWLITSNTQVWIVLLAVASAINWAELITAYNIAHVQPGRRPDVSYLIDIGGNLSQMVELSKTVPFTEKEKNVLRQRITDNERRLREIQFPGYSMRMNRNKEAIAAYYRSHENTP